jgi:hypothetical protein
LKTRNLEKSGVFILLKACPTGFFHGKTPGVSNVKKKPTQGYISL